jgi:hypothetical protein
VQTESRFRMLRPIGGPIRTIEVLGQCQCCHDLFGVLIFRHKGELYAQETASMHMVKASGGKSCLVHRRGICNGEVKLYGSEWY